jgi:hypothetical protein
MRRMIPVADQCRFSGNEARVYPNRRRSTNVGWSRPLETTNEKDPSSISRGSQATTLVETSYRPRRSHATQYIVTPSKERSYPVPVSRTGTNKDDTMVQTVYHSSRLQHPRQSVYVHQDRRHTPHVSGRQADDDRQTEDGGGSMRNVGKDSADLWDSVEDEILPEDSVSRPRTSLQPWQTAAVRTEHTRRSDTSRNRRHAGRHGHLPAKIDTPGREQSVPPFFVDRTQYHQGLPYHPMAMPYADLAPHVPYSVSHRPPRLYCPPHHESTAIPSSPPPPPHLTHIPYYQSISRPTYQQHIPPVAPTSKPPFSAPGPLDTEALAKPIASSKEDPIKIVEDYLESLRGTKETELLEANRILTWIDRHFR